MKNRDAPLVTGERQGIRPDVRLLQILLGGLAVAYLLQVYSPLRLNTDAIFYLSRAASLVDGTDFVYPNDRRPLGYSYLIAALDRLGLGASWAFAALNGLFIGIAVAASFSLWQRVFALPRRTATLLCCLMLLSFSLVKYAVVPIADIAFFGVVLLSLHVLARASEARTAKPWPLLAAALALIIWSITLRTIGVALVPALLWTAWAILRARGYRLEKRLVLPAALVVVALLAVAAAFVVRTGYIDELRDLYTRYGVSNNLAYMATSRLREWGELLVNVPASKAPAFAGPIIPVFGVAAILTVLAGIYLRRKNWGLGEVFVSTYVLILLIYPGNDVRYWLPVLPLLMGWAAVVVRAGFRFRAVRLALACYLVWFAVAGAGALVYSSRITFAGASFPERFGDGTLRRTYEIAFNGGQIPPGLRGEEVRREALVLLLRYEPRLRVQPAP